MNDAEALFNQYAVKNSSEPQPAQDVPQTNATPAAPMAAPTPQQPNDAQQLFEQHAVKQSGATPEKAALPPSSPDSSLWDRVKAPFVGMGREAVKMGAYGSPENYMVQDPDHPDNPTAVPEAAVKKAEEYLPKPKDQVEAGLQGAGASAINPLALMAGPVGVASAATAGGITAWRDAASPGTPGWNALWGLMGGIAAPSALNTAFRLGKIGLENIGLMEPNKLVQAWKDLGITNVTAAQVGPERSMPKTVRSFRESPVTNVINRTEEKGVKQLEDAVERQATELGFSRTPEEAGSVVEADLGSYTDRMKQLIGAGNNAINRAVDPITTRIPFYQYYSRLVDALSPTPGAEAQSGGLLPKAQAYLNNLTNDIVKQNNLGYGAGDSLPLAAVKEVKRNIGDLLEQSILAGADTSKRQLKTIYGILADAERSAYTGTPFENAFNMLQNTSAKFYEELENSVAPLIDRGLTPERIYQTLLNQAKIGGTKLESIFDAAPLAKDEVAAATLRQMGQATDGTFNPGLFFRQWNRLAPEAKQALFGDAKGDMPKVYDQLALMAQRQMEGGAARNFSGTAGTSRIFAYLLAFSHSIAGGAGIAASRAIPGLESEFLGATSASAGAMTLTAATEAVVPHLLTFKPFVRWLATDPPLGSFSENVLKSFIADAPALAPDLTAFYNFVHHPNQNKSADQSHHFMGGGYAGWGCQAHAGYAEGGPTGPTLRDKLDRIDQLQRDRWAYDRGDPAAGVPIRPFTSIANDELKKDPKGYALGGLTDVAQPNQLPEATEKGGKHKDVTQEENALYRKLAGNTPTAQMMLLMGSGNGYADGGEVIPLCEPNVDPFNMDWRYELGDNASVLDHVFGSTWRNGFSCQPEWNLQNSRPVQSYNVDIENDIKPNPKNDPRFEDRGQAPGFRQMEDQENNGPVYPRQSFEDAINDKTTSYRGGGLASSPFGIGRNDGGLTGYAEGGPANDEKVRMLRPPRPVQMNTFLPAAQANEIDAATVNDNYDPRFSHSMQDKLLRAFRGFAQGGIAHDASKNDPRPFYNPQLPRVVGGGWAGGGPVGGSEIGSYAEGGTVNNEEKLLNQIAFRESNFRNVMNYINDRTHTAGGLYQITNSTWHQYAPQSILAKWGRAIDAPPEVQREVARIILHSPGGIHHWADYNAKLAADLKSGNYPDHSPPSSILDHFLGGSDGSHDTQLTQQDTPQPEETEVGTVPGPSKADLAVANLPSDDPFVKGVVHAIWEGSA